ncbi:MAG: hypothetical protein IJE40_06870 [Clostridia bacterium]|nr:hypothetical protein [Clostridia bacterium]
MKNKDYTIKERYCPSRGENIIVRVEASITREETCLSCNEKQNCKVCVLGINKKSLEKQ